MINVTRSGFTEFKWLFFAAACLLVILSGGHLSCWSLASEFGENYPCFHCEANKAQIRAHNVPPTTTCVPAYFHLVWDLTEKRMRNDSRIGPSSQMSLVLEENYTGCLSIDYRTASMEQMLFTKIAGPYPVSSASRKIKRISAQFGLSRPSRIPFAGDVFSTTETSRPDDFSIQPELYGEKSLKHECSTEIELNYGTIYMPRILPKQELIAPDTWKLIEDRYPWAYNVDVSLDKLFTCEDLVRALRSKTSIIKTLPFSFQFGSNKNGGFLSVLSKEDREKYITAMDKVMTFRRNSGINNSTVGNVTINISFEPREEPRLKVSPEEGLIAAGPDKAGRFSPDRKTYTLTNTGQSPLVFAATHTSDWISLDNSGGILKAGASTHTKVSLNNKARQLGEGPHKDIITFTNTINGKGNTTRQVELSIEERWRITINDYGYSYLVHTGSGGLNKRAGLRYHLRRTIDVKIRDGKFHSGDGSAKFASLKNYSYPSWAYTCKAATTTIIGSGIDIEAERLDQTKWTSRFNPPKNAHDAALKKQWEKIKKNKTPYINPRNFSVSGNKSGKKLTIKLPKYSVFTLGIYCKLDVAEVKKRGYTISQNTEIEWMDIERTELYPHSFSVQLTEGWKQKNAPPGALEYTEIEVTKLK